MRVILLGDSTIAGKWVKWAKSKFHSVTSLVPKFLYIHKRITVDDADIVIDRPPFSDGSIEITGRGGFKLIVAVSDTTGGYDRKYFYNVSGGVCTEVAPPTNMIDHTAYGVASGSIFLEMENPFTEYTPVHIEGYGVPGAVLSNGRDFKFNNGTAYVLGAAYETNSVNLTELEFIVEYRSEDQSVPPLKVYFPRTVTAVPCCSLAFRTVAYNKIPNLGLSYRDGKCILFCPVLVEGDYTIKLANTSLNDNFYDAHAIVRAAYIFELKENLRSNYIRIPLQELTVDPETLEDFVTIGYDSKTGSLLKKKRTTRHHQTAGDFIMCTKSFREDINLQNNTTSVTELTQFVRSHDGSDGGHWFFGPHRFLRYLDYQDPDHVTFNAYVGYVDPTSLDPYTFQICNPYSRLLFGAHDSKYDFLETVFSSTRDTYRASIFVSDELAYTTGDLPTYKVPIYDPQKPLERYTYFYYDLPIVSKNVYPLSFYHDDYHNCCVFIESTRRAVNYHEREIDGHVKSIVTRYLGIDYTWPAIYFTQPYCVLEIINDTRYYFYVDGQITQLKYPKGEEIITTRREYLIYWYEDLGQVPGNPTPTPPPGFPTDCPWLQELFSIPYCNSGYDCDGNAVDDDTRYIDRIYISADRKVCAAAFDVYDQKWAYKVSTSPGDSYAYFPFLGSLTPCRGASIYQEWDSTKHPLSYPVTDHPTTPLIDRLCCAIVDGKSMMFRIPTYKTGNTLWRAMVGFAAYDEFR